LVVYVGPTLPASHVRRIAPTAEIEPPVEAGALQRAHLKAGDVVVLIDGYYRDRPAVRHKEILHVMHAGATVIGAASMGAMRAAELAQHGMIGVGRVYHMYRDDEICGDDEVAVRHSPDAFAYRADSIALVNLRYGTRLAVELGVARPSTVDALVSTARRLVFDERTWPRLTAAVKGELNEDERREIPALVEFCRQPICDVKAQDAALALARGERLRAGAEAGGERDREPSGRPPQRPGPRNRDPVDQPRWCTSYLRDWVTYWRCASIGDGDDWISDLDVLDAARLYYDGYPDIHHEILTALLSELAARAGHADRASMGRYVMELVGLGPGDDVPDRLSRFLSADERRLTVAEQAAHIVRRVWPLNICRDWRPPVVARLTGHPRWSEWKDIVRRADEARNGTETRGPERMAGLIFLHRWGVSGPAVTPELGRRGFLTLSGLDQVAARFAILELRRAEDARRAVGTGTDRA
jgi:hypothetical protein